jgi:peptide/nickel transport system substrate-binding protein
MRTRLGIALLGVAALVGGCGGAGSSSSGGSTTSGGSTVVKTGGLLRVGTTSAIDSLNPFVAIESEAYNAFVMEYPQLVQYGPGLTIQGDWATSWTTSADGKTWTFHLRPNTHWSDGQPMTAADAAWTANTILKYQSGPTAKVAPALTHLTTAVATDATTLVLHYSQAASNVLAQLEQFWILPQHVWQKYTANAGKDLLSYRPEQSLPTVAGGPYVITQFAEKGTTVYKPNPYFYGTKSNAAAVALVYYTNSTSEIADMKAGNLDFVEQTPFDAIGAVKTTPGIQIGTVPNSEVTNITFNSNPVKPKNRELLNPTVKMALEYATDRNQIVSVVFAGYATPWANIISQQSIGAGWVNPAVLPLPFDIAKANQILDGLGYTRGSNGVRTVPATAGKYAQPAHAMIYDVMVPTSLDYNGDRTFQIIKNDWAQVGVQINEVSGGDSTQAYAYETAGNYTKFDIALWDWVGYIDPDFMLSVLTKAQWNSWSDTGFDNPQYDQWYAQQGTLLDRTARQALVYKMEKYIADERPYIQIANEKLVAAWSGKWTGFYPDLNAYCKCYYTNPHQS